MCELETKIHFQHTPTASDFVAKAEEDVFTTAAAPPPPPPEVSLYNTYEAASDIPYTPEAAFNEGLGMVQTIRNYVKKLQLGSKLRQEVWMRELDRFVPILHLYIVG